MFFISSFISLGSSYFIYYCMTAQRDYTSLLLASPCFSYTQRETLCLSLAWSLSTRFPYTAVKRFTDTTTLYEICICWFAWSWSGTIQRALIVWDALRLVWFSLVFFSVSFFPLLGSSLGFGLSLWDNGTLLSLLIHSYLPYASSFSVFFFWSCVGLAFWRITLLYPCT